MPRLERKPQVVIQPAVPQPNPARLVTGAIGDGPPTQHLATPDAAHLDEAAEGSEPAETVETGAVGVPGTDPAQRYCVSVSEAAADARLAWQRTKLAETEQQLARRIALLEEKTAEFKAWLDRRNEFSQKANETLVQIYTRMEPDSAAQQLATMDEETAAAVLSKLNPRSSSTILNEMKPEKAARLTATIAGAARVSKPVSAPVPEAVQRASNEPVEPEEVGRRQ